MGGLLSPKRSVTKEVISLTPSAGAAVCIGIRLNNRIDVASIEVLYTFEICPSIDVTGGRH